MNRKLLKYQQGSEVKKPGNTKRAVVLAEAPPEERFTHEINSYLKYNRDGKIAGTKNLSELPPALKDRLNEFIKADKAAYEASLTRRKEHDTFRKKAEDLYEKHFPGKNPNNVLIGGSPEYVMRDLQGDVNMELPYQNTNIQAGFMKDYTDLYEKQVNRNKSENKLFEERSRIMNSFYADKSNPKIKTRRDEFIKEANNLKAYYAKKDPNTKVEVIPVYKEDKDTIERTIKSLDANDNIFIFGHSGDQYAGIENSWWSEKLKNSNYQNCYLGSCSTEKIVNKDFSGLKNFTYRPEGSWWGVNPNADSLEGAMYSRKTNPDTNFRGGEEATIGKPKVGVDIKTINKRMMGGKLPKHQTDGVVASGPYAAMAQAGIGTGLGAFASYMSNDGQMVNRAPQEQQTKRQWDPFQLNAWGAGIMGAYALTKGMLNRSNEKNYENYKADWIRRYQIPSLIQDPNKFSSVQYEAQMAKKGGMTMNTPEDQGAGYFKYPNASSLIFPGRGERTFVPGPFPLMVKDQNGTQIMTNKPVKTRGRVTEIPIFQEGGEVRLQAPIVDRDEATIEAEKGELIFGAGMPGDVEDQEDRVGVGLYRVGGKPHSQGGTPLKAYPGDFVFSDDTSLAATKEQSKLILGREIKQLKKRTPAKLANRYMNMNKFIDMAQDKDQDPISKKTAILNVNNFIDRLAEIALVQEEKKGFPDGVPQFVQASMDTRFDAQGLQQEMNEYKYGGAVLPKHQTQGMVITKEMREKLRQVDEVPEGYQHIGTIGGKNYYQNSAGQTVTQPAPTATKLEKDPYKLLKTYGTRKTNPLNTYSYDDLLKEKYVGQDKPELRNYWDQFYQPGQGDDYVYTADYARDNMSGFPRMDRGPLPTAPNKPSGLSPLDDSGNPSAPSTSEQPLNNYIQGANSQFNINVAEAYGLAAAATPSESRFPPAFRNWEIQNAKALVASSGRPISEQPYLNSIARSNLGYDAANAGADPISATRQLGAYQKSLEAQNQAIGQVYGQNMLRGDQRDMKLAEFEVMDGVDRITNAEKYDNKLEMLANNKELEAKDRRLNINRLLNQMKRTREAKTLYNMTSDYYQINRDDTIGLKPTYQVIDGKIVPYQRNIADLIRGAGSTTDARYLQRAEAIFKLMNRYGIRGSSSIDDLIRESSIPPGQATQNRF